MLDILMVDFPLHPDVDVRHCTHDRPWSVDDADIIVFTTPGNLIASSRVHWSREIEKALQDGKTLFFFASAPGVAELLGTLLPFELPPSEPAFGDVIRLSDKAHLIEDYFHAFKEYFSYRVRFKLTDNWTSLLLTKPGNRSVGLLGKHAAGHVVILPSLPYFEDTYQRYVHEGYLDELEEEEEPDTHDGPLSDLAEDQWERDFLAMSHSLIQQLLQIDSWLRGEHTLPPPDWANEPTFQTPRLQTLLPQLAKIASQINQLESKRDEIRAQASDAAELSLLLYAKGKPLERAVLKALRLFGFQAEPFANAISEFDAVFTHEDIRLLGEAEGRDNSPIGVDKIRQLCTNLDEDYARDEVDEYAKGVLFGNPQRLLPPDQRDVDFTHKSRTMAKQRDIALILTSSLFRPAAYLEQCPDENYAKACRDSILTCSGAIAQLPAPPDEVPEQPDPTTFQP